MTSEELAEALGELGLSKSDLAKLIGLTARAVNLWSTREREIPGPVEAYLRLLRRSPKSVQAQELAILKQEDPTMYEGMYSFHFRGHEGPGVGAFVLTRGRAYGSDGLVSYDGAYQPNPEQPGCLDVYLTLRVPPGVGLVTGVPPQPTAYEFDVQATITARGESSFHLETPFGPVGVAVRYLRPIPSDLAA